MSDVRLARLETMIEWSDKNRYNSFNSMKGLAYYEHYKEIIDWFDGKGELPTPIECSLDPIMKCNHHCYYCNSQRYLREFPNSIPCLSWNEMYNLIIFLAEWGVRGLCFGGGGESTLHSDVPTMLNLAHQKGLETAIITNGSMLYDVYLRTALLHCRWVGISLDAGDAETFRQIRGIDMFQRVIDGITRLVQEKKETKTKVDIAVKVLVLPENYDKLYDICLIAKSLGVDDFHIRPVDLERKDFKIRHKLNFDIPLIYEQFVKCHELETDTFHVYTVMHKYDEEFHVKHDFTKCLASPLVLQCCTDGNAYVCVDHRLEERFKLGSFSNVKEWWGNNKHRELVQSIKPIEECSRCTWGEYNRQIEEVKHDSMCLAFP